MYKTLGAALAATFVTAGASSAAVVGIAADCAVDAAGPTGLTAAGFTCSSDADRTAVSAIEIYDDGSNAVASGGDFYSLGLGGSLVIEFDPVITGSTTVVEVTFGGNSSSHDEEMEIYGSNDGLSFDLLGSANNQATGNRNQKTTVAFAGSYSFLGFLDVSEAAFPGTDSKDGFDIAAISVDSVTGGPVVPLPASAVLLLAGLGAIAGVKRRKA